MTTTAPPTAPFIVRLERWVVMFTVVAVSLYVSVQSKESFRTPKELLFHILVLGAIAVHAIAWARGALGPLTPEARRIGAVIAAILGWTLVTTLTSTNPLLSWFALFHAALAAAFFWIVLRTASRGTAKVRLTAVLVASLSNSILAILQRHEIWSPFAMEELGRRETVIGALGNPNDLGGFLVACALAHLAVIFTGSRIERSLHGTGFGLACYAVAATESATAIAALAVGISLLLLSELRRQSRSRVLGAVLIALGVVSAASLVSKDSRLVNKWYAAQTGLDELFGSRVLAYRAAWRMAGEHPLAGVGPGTFSWNYIESVIEVRRANPTLMTAPTGRLIFGEVHSDYLEILAETGGIGLTLFLVSLTIFFHSTRAKETRPPPRSEPASGILAWPLAASLMVQMAFNFPLQITAVLVIYLFLGGHALSWQLSPDSE